MKKHAAFLAVIFVMTLALNAFAEPQPLQIQYDSRYRAPQKSTVLKGSVSQSQNLPAGMYGMWQVNGTLLETTNYEKFRRRSSDIWVLRKDGEFVTLINPQNGASATITVTEVIDNTATFERGISSGNQRESEQVTLTLDGENFYGTDFIMSQEKINGVTVSDVAKYKVYGIKLSGQTMYRPRGATTVGR